ncbi:hypothetical protein, partial [Pseudomonas sp. SIMBA_044]|uniref:hypothetical protein n=1 Tax=Pseudomonas sp. SIMBA_044 TaxID=3085785 RepID=UPI00397B80F9
MKLFIVLVLTGCMGLAVELIGLGFAAYVQLASGSGLTASLLDEPMLWLSLIILLAVFGHDTSTEIDSEP